MATRLLLGVLWAFQFLPLALQAACGRALGQAGWILVPQRRKVALRNLELCFPEWRAAERERVAREHFRWLGRSLLERGLLWYASPERLKRLIHV
ncbi:MAG TPA: lipid A biosynthesis acyltransferase, partial [Caldimonas sp.]|nr:lipid A biosynthesis acyltransferase [Caldimonas sp.]